MNKADKKRADDFVKILRDVHSTIRKTVDARNIETTLQLLEQCQSCAIGIGEMIEAAEGEGHPTVALLEEYCETVYEIYEQVRRSEFPGGNQTHNRLSEQLIRIGKSIKQDINVRKEAVLQEP